MFADLVALLPICRPIQVGLSRVDNSFLHRWQGGSHQPGRLLYTLVDHRRVYIYMYTKQQGIVDILFYREVVDICHCLILYSVVSHLNALADEP